MRCISFPQPPAPPPLPTELARAGSLFGKQAFGGSAAGLHAAAPLSSAALEPFARLIADQIHQVQTTQSDANDLVQQMLGGQDVNQSEVLTAVQKADLAYRTLLQVRNQLIQAYQELQQIQI